MVKINKYEGQTISEKAYNYLRNAVIDMKYKPGEPIIESAVCRDLGISRTPLREALRLLESEKLVSVYPRRGAFVRIVDLGRVQEIFQVREMLEGEVARLVVPFISGEELSKIKEKLLKIKETLNEGGDEAVEKAIKEGQKFHAFVFAEFGNETLIKFLKNLEVEQMRACSYVTRGKKNTGRFLDDHLNIIEALLKRDGTKAKELMNKHIRNAKEMLLA